MLGDHDRRRPAACDAFLPVYLESKGLDGYVSLELDPTSKQHPVRWLRVGSSGPRVDRANLMIKVPATAAGLPVIHGLLADGFNVSVTLLFAVERYDEVVECA